MQGIEGCYCDVDVVVGPCTFVDGSQRFGKKKHSALKMETICFAETLALTYETTRREDPKQN
jgi:hypothetical protein